MPHRIHAVAVASILLSLAFCRLAIAADYLDLNASGDMQPYENPALALDARLDDLLARLSPEEKASLLQMESPAIERLGIPPHAWWSEAIHGVARRGRATQYPVSIALAATWDPELLQQIAAAIGDEARALHHADDPNTQHTRYHGLTIWSPTINMARDPRWGRTEETYGEDPWLVSRMAVAFVRGLQGDDPRYLKAVATVKHFAANNTEHNRFSVRPDISERNLREYYFPAFQAAVQEAYVASLMCAYNGVNGVPCGANRWLLTDVLRGDWGFGGAVVTDVGVPENLIEQHAYVKTNAEAAAAMLNAGVDVFSTSKHFETDTVQAVTEGAVSAATLDQAVRRNLRLRFRLGQFDPPAINPYAAISTDVVGCAKHVALARRAAREGIVLLKNASPPGREQPLLPIDPAAVRRIIVAGPFADMNQLGGYSGDPTRAAETPFDAIRTRAGGAIAVARGVSTTQPADPLAEGDPRSTLVIYIGGLSIEHADEDKDLMTFDLPDDQQADLRRIVDAFPNVVVVLNGGRPIVLGDLDRRVPAILHAFYAGQEGGLALADLLFGDANPAGREPLTLYRSADDLPDFEDYAIEKGRTYMYLRRPPAYAFGHGLSYATFEYSPLRLSAASLGRGDTLSVKVDIRNTGSRDGDEVVQLYVRRPGDTDREPLEQLKAFQRVSIPASQTRVVDLTLPIARLARWDDAAKRFVVPAGEWELRVGASSADIRSTAKVSVE